MESALRGPRWVSDQRPDVAYPLCRGNQAVPEDKRHTAVSAVKDTHTAYRFVPASVFCLRCGCHDVTHCTAAVLRSRSFIGATILSLGVCDEPLLRCARMRQSRRSCFGRGGLQCGDSVRRTDTERDDTFQLCSARSVRPLDRVRTCQASPIAPRSVPVGIVTRLHLLDQHHEVREVPAQSIQPPDGDGVNLTPASGQRSSKSRDGLVEGGSRA